MKLKPDKRKLKNSIVVCLFMLLFNFLFSSLCYLLIWYWAIPNISTVLPIFKKWIESLGDDVLPFAYDFLYAVSACIAVFPSAVLAYGLSKTRRKEFIAYSKARISYLDGIKYHGIEYGLYDLACSFGLVMVLAIVYAFAGDVFIVKCFPIALTMFQSLGSILGTMVTVILTGVAMLAGIFFSQKKWRAEYFINE